MPQFHLYVPSDLAEEIQSRAKSRGLSVSRYLAEVVRQDLARDWPEGFFEEVVGGWV